MCEGIVGDVRSTQTSHSAAIFLGAIEASVPQHLCPRARSAVVYQLDGMLQSAMEVGYVPDARLWEGRALWCGPRNAETRFATGTSLVFSPTFTVWRLLPEVRDLLETQRL